MIKHKPGTRYDISGLITRGGELFLSLMTIIVQQYGDYWSRIKKAHYVFIIYCSLKPNTPFDHTISSSSFGASFFSSFIGRINPTSSSSFGYENITCASSASHDTILSDFRVVFALHSLKIQIINTYVPSSISVLLLYFSFDSTKTTALYV